MQHYTRLYKNMQKKNNTLGYIRIRQDTKFKDWQGSIKISVFSHHQLIMVDSLLFLRRDLTIVTLYTVHCILSLNCTLYMVHGTLYTLYFILYTVSCTHYIVHCTLYTVHCTLYTVHCILYTVHWTLYTKNCTLYTVHCKRCMVQATLYTVQGAQCKV